MPFRLSMTLGPAIALCIATTAQVAVAQEPALSVELNNATDVEAACRLTFAATNASGMALAGLSYEVVLYDLDGIVPADGFLLFEFGQLPDAKTKVVQFVLEDRSCAQISRILVNDVAECRADSGELDFCLTGLGVSSRNEIAFTL